MLLVVNAATFIQFSAVNEFILDLWYNKWDGFSSICFKYLKKYSRILLFGIRIEGNSVRDEKSKYRIKVGLERGIANTIFALTA